MRACELMVGDYVKQCHCGRIIRVAEVVPPFVRDDTLVGQYHEDTIEPITITEGFLETNGFSTPYINGDLFVCKGENAGVPYSLEHKISTKALFLNLALIPEPICNVHQLQHFCDIIHKEITL